MISTSERRADPFAGGNTQQLKLNFVLLPFLKLSPSLKKGSKNKIENYRPIANLCSASKIFEKSILKHIHYLESTNNLDSLTGKQQHGFEKNPLHKS